jgi:hypothetical protein
MFVPSARDARAPKRTTYRALRVRERLRGQLGSKHRARLA